MKLLVKKTQTGLRPMYDSDFEIYSKIPLGAEFEIDYKQKRNILFHRKYFALLKMVFENQEIYSNIEDLRLDLIIETGRYTEQTNIFTGEIKKVAHSISFASLDEIGFSKLYEETKSVIAKYFNFNKKEIDENIQQYF